MKFGAGIIPDFESKTTDGRQVVNLAKKIEKWGYDYLWIPDERLCRNVYSLLALCAFATERVKIGTMVTDPYSRSPALTAAAIATVDEISRGRVILGIGAGGTYKLQELCIDRKKPALAIRETIEVVRRLFTGKCVTYDGEVVKLKEAELGFTARDDISIYVAGNGPKILEVAGELADGVVIGTLTSKTGLEASIDRIRKGIEKAGRNPEDLTTVSWVYTSISEDGDLAREIVKPKVASMIRNIYPSRRLKESGIKDEQLKCIVEELKPCPWQDVWSSLNVRRRLAKIVPDDVSDKFSLAGTPDEIVKKVNQLEKIGINQIAIFPFPNVHERPEEVMRRFANGVISQFGTHT